MRPVSMAVTDVTTTRPTKILFHVVDKETGNELAGAKVHAAFFGPGGAGESHDLLTDNHGDAAIREPDDAEKKSGPNVFVTTEGYVPKVVNFHQIGVPAEYIMKLDAAMTVGGWVVDEQGSAVSGVEILIEGPGNIRGQAENIDFQTCPVTSRDNGGWTCSYIPKDWTNEFRFVLKKDGYATTFPMVPVAKVNLNKLVLVINRGYTVTGRVVDEQNQSVADARIKILAGGQHNRQTTKTTEIGSFTFTGVAGESDTSQDPPLETDGSGAAFIRGLVGEGPLHVDLVVQADGHAPQLRTVILSYTTNVTNFVLSPGKVFRGQVVNEADDPVTNAVVQTDWDNRGLRGFEWQTRTDAEGRFEWDSAPESPVLFWIESPGYKVERGVPFVADSSFHTITLKRVRPQ